MNRYLITMNNKLLREIVDFYKNENINYETPYSEDEFKMRVGDDLFNKITNTINQYYQNNIQNNNIIDARQFTLDQLQDMVYRNINDQLNKYAKSNIVQDPDVVALQKIDLLINKALTDVTDYLKINYRKNQTTK